MKKSQAVVLLLVFFSLVTGYLLSSISLIGRAGISLFYTKYQFLKSWWKGALLVLIVWIALFLLQSLLLTRVSKKSANIILSASLVTAIIGIFYSYLDFRNTLSHRWLGERFHLGVYLFWLIWIAITIFVATERKPLKEISNTESANDILS